MKINRHGYPYIIALAITIAVLCLLKVYLLAILPFLFFIFTAYFFRDPERKITKEKSSVISPADGKVTEVREASNTENELLEEGQYIKIGIFLALYNVHVNRSPVDGIVEKVLYKKGQFVTAMREDSSHINEANNVLVKMDSGKKLLLRQIAGVAARRIVFDKKSGSRIEQGERIGIIKFGSRTEIFLPKEAVADIIVKVGDKVHGGINILARLK